MMLRAKWYIVHNEDGLYRVSLNPLQIFFDMQLLGMITNVYLAEYEGSDCR